MSDLKCCRLVSRKFNRMVMDETKYKDRVVLKVKKKKLTMEEFGKTEEVWKKVSLNFPVKRASSLSNYEWLYPLVTQVEYLSLRLHGSAPSSSTSIDFHPLLGRLLSSCKKLKSLALEPDFVLRGSSPISEGAETLEALEQLEILLPDYHTMDQLPEHEGNKRIIPEFFEKLRNVKVYKSYCPQFSMNSLMSIPTELRSGRAWIEALFLFGLAEAVVQNNRQHLRSHAFYDVSVVTVGAIRPWASSRFETPALLAVEADCHTLQLPIQIASFTNYLNSRPKLEQLDITCHYDDPEDNSLLSGLIHAVARHGRTLKNLKLWMKLGNIRDWILLRESSSLVDLRLEDCRMEEKENEWIRQVMANVPKSIEKIYLRGALLQWGRKKRKPPTEPLKTEYFTRLDPQLLTQLSIFNAGALVDNQVADFICKNFKLLRKLNLTYAQTNDEGFREIAGLKG